MQNKESLKKSIAQGQFLDLCPPIKAFFRRNVYGGATTLSIITLSIMTLIITIKNTTLRIMPLSETKLKAECCDA